MVSELLQEIKLGLAESGTFVGSTGEVLVETFHEGDGVDVIWQSLFATTGQVGHLVN